MNILRREEGVKGIFTLPFTLSLVLAMKAWIGRGGGAALSPRPCRGSEISNPLMSLQR